jgi:site-specific DNA-methyltransferase (adenine-specific)/site-specific DNA-methyltransferase (cytosine-N4-specific)
MLKVMDAESVDLIVTSPPYAERRKKAYGGIPADKYVEWFLPISAELMRVLKPTGSFILNIKEGAVNGERQTYVLELVLALRKQGWLWIEEYIWHKRNSVPGKWPNRFRDAWEHCYHFTKKKKFYMNQDAVKVPIGDWAKPRLKTLGKNDVVRNESKTWSGFGKNMSRWVGKDRVYPTNVLHLATESNNKGHSAAFPVELPAWFIKVFSPVGGTVLDPFMGSGTTALAARSLGRRYEGVEAIQDYVVLNAERLVANTVIEERAIGVRRKQ